MCGIIGYWNASKEAFPFLFNGLKGLEYRGYDSFGFAVLSGADLQVRRAVGKIDASKISHISGHSGIAHTRWATHGNVSEKNSHPQVDCKKRIAVVHNGIIENYQKLREFLISKNHQFISDTDTEVLPHLIEDELGNGRDLREAVMNVSKIIEGRNSFIVLDSLTGQMLAVRKGSPLILGVKIYANECDEVFVASDILAFTEHTNKVIYLDDGEGVLISDRLRFFNLKNGKDIHKRVIEIEVSAEKAGKGEYEHYMLKEIMEQKETLRRAINQDYKEVMDVAEMINKARGVFFVGCGTAARVCHVAEYLFSEIANKHINFVNASEFSNYKHFLLPETLVIAVSQSGETADVLEALNVAKSKGSKIVSIVNVSGSSIARISDNTFLINAGPERAVASTKATTSQLAVVLLLAYACVGKIKEGKRELIDLIGEINDMLNPRYVQFIQSVAYRLRNSRNIFIIGRGINYPIALESAIKIMEVSYIHAQGFAGGELKHGPIALIEKGSPVIALVAEDSVKNEILSNAIEVKSRGALVVGVSPENNEIFDIWIRVPKAISSASTIVNLIPVQLLAYYLGLLNNRDIDMPRNLAKSVTVK